MSPGMRNALLGAGVFALLSFLAIQTPEQRGQLAGGTLPGQSTNLQEGPLAVGEGVTQTTAGGAQTAQGGSAGQTGNLECKAGRNGGATDVGVTGKSIRVASTHVLSGIGASFLGTSNVGMRAVVAKVNSTGGICGRLIDLTLRDDGWDAATGASFIGNFIKEGYFALPVVPSSEGLTASIKNKTLDSGGIPVIGSDGMLKEQYQSRLVWPVATATVATMRAMVKHAYEKLGVREFGIVYDNQYKFGLEGAEAFKQYVGKLGGAKVASFVGIQPGQPSYTETQTFNTNCGPDKRCEFVAMLLEPGTALSWINSQGNDDAGKRLGFGSKGTGGAQTLFNDRFARDCGLSCSGMLLWTGYNPPIGPLKNVPDVAEYMADVEKISPTADTTNQFLEGAYLGMKVFVEALRKVGPGLTRAKLIEAMDSLTYRSGLAGDLTWAPGKHYANNSAQAFEIVTSGGGFSGFRSAQTGWIPDPEPGNFPSIG